MEQPPPLTPQDMSKLSGGEYAQLGEPQQVKIFGIMHLVFGGIGSLGLIWGLIVVIFGNPMIKFMGKTPQAEMQATLESKLYNMSLVGIIVAAITTTLIIKAGYLLVKKRKNAVQWSNMYAWAAIAGKVFNLILALIYTVPLTREMMLKAGPSAAKTAAFTDAIMMGGIVVGFIFSCAYPTLALILLNRPKVKTWFASQPE